MENHHKKLLRENRVTLVQDMDLAYVFDGLVERNIFEPADYEDLKVGSVIICISVVIVTRHSVGSQCDHSVDRVSKHITKYHK